MRQTTDPTYRTTAADQHVERLDAETIVYDVRTDHVHRLTADATAVRDACIGGATAEAIGTTTGLDHATVEAALLALSSAGLVEQLDDDGLSRRAFGMRLVLGAAGVAGAALVTSIVAPTPAAAESASGGGGQSGGGDDCQTDCG